MNSEGSSLRGDAAGVDFAVDLRQAAEQEVGDIGQGGGPAWRNPVLDNEQGQASQEGVDAGGELGSGQDVVAKGGGEVDFGLGGVLRSVAEAKDRVVEGGKMAAAPGLGAMGASKRRSRIE